MADVTRVGAGVSSSSTGEDALLAALALTA